MKVYCPRHRIGYNDDFDPACPQGAVSGTSCPDPWEIDDRPTLRQADGTTVANPEYGWPIVPEGVTRPRNLRSVLGR